MKRLTLQELLNVSASRYTDKPALAFTGGEPVTYRQVAETAGRLGRYLKNIGARKGDRIALLGENMPNWGIAYFAVTAAGYVAVPILPDFTADDVAQILEHSEAKAVFVSDRLASKLDGGTRKDVVRVRMDDFSAYRPEAEQDQDTPETILEDDLAAIIYTSGTTGNPKGVMLCHRNIVSNVIAASPIPRMKKDERVLSILPLSHTYECTIGFLIPFYLGACIYYIKKPPTPTVLQSTLRQIKPGVMLSVPLLIEKIYRQKIKPALTGSALTRFLLTLGPFRKILHLFAGMSLKKFFGGRLYFFGIGGAPLAPDVEQFLREARFPYAIGYGLTETSPLVAGDNAKNSRFQSTGRVLRGVQVRLLDPDPHTGEGEILVKGPNVMKGYYKDPERTAEVFTEDGWFRTGDLAVMNDKGYVYIKGRSKNVILGPSGENVYPETIESLINSFPYVDDSLVFSHNGRIIARIRLNYESLEEYLKTMKEGAVELAEYAGKHLAEIRSSVNARLSHFSRVNSVIEQTMPFEKTPTHKIKRFLYTKLPPKAEN